MKKDEENKNKGHIERVGKDGVITGPQPDYGKAEVIDSHRGDTEKFAEGED